MLAILYIVLHFRSEVCDDRNTTNEMNVIRTELIFIQSSYLLLKSNFIFIKLFSFGLR